ncbi:efflux RND transporter periplasmic adaptor subunit [Vibrio agarivorans]|uniref:efflux RND transporter periplasmic adaptor subunit n=1 Tax=Vibrio agarivorans TaxID=153622 RepID=UPI0025B35AF1|nr:efflux RND transporter periplasmic adaptor subunit [Vibrio agarivorans]MDN3661319.1 efflux RND transporter periplasmic adaptor subunit [Vibrio agarivorans]
MDSKMGSTLSIIGLISSMLVITACSQESAPIKTSVNLPIAEVIEPQRSEQYQVEREYVGFVRAKDQARLGFELSGQIESIFVDVGDTVSEGQALITLDKRLLITQARQLEAQQAEVTAQLKLIETNLKRQLSLQKKGFSAEAEIDSLTSQKNALLANRQQLKASLEANRLQQEKSTIIAPFSGVISQRLVSKGDVVTTGTPTLTLLANSTHEVHIGVPTKYVADILQKQQWQIRIDGDYVAANLINPGAQVNTQSRTVELRFALPHSSKPFDGQLGYLQYQDHRNQQGYWLPLSALTDGLRGTWNVFIVDSEDKVHRAHVELIYANNDAAFVKGELKSGDRVVASGLHRIIPGQIVQTEIITNQAHNALATTNP